MAKVMTRLMMISVSAGPAMEPVACHWITTIAPSRPKMAPEAPTVTALGVTSNAPAEPARPETR
jgi:hypothetical protein